MILTLKELAEHLKVNERTILRMLKTGQIKGTKIGGQWRFNGSQVDQIFFPEDPDNPERIPLNELTPGHVSVPVSRVMKERRFVMEMKSTDVESALKELCLPVIAESLIPDVNTLRERLTAREKLLSTGVGRGIAIPHPRDPLPTLREPAVLVFGRSSQGIEFNAADGSPVRIFFLLCCQNIQMHLVLMARLAQLLQHEEFLAACNSAGSAQEIVRAALEAERLEFFSQSVM